MQWFLDGASSVEKLAMLECCSLVVYEQSLLPSIVYDEGSPWVVS